MGLSSAMLTGFTGIKSNQTAIDTIGDNVANINTTAFKNQRALFETAFYRTLTPGVSPSDTTGGTNPIQVGFGSQVGAIQRSFVQGTSQSTGIPSDLAIEGNGFFIVQGASNELQYTRAGAFALDENNVLVNPSGDAVQGYTADADGNVTAGTMDSIIIPLGSESSAQATETVVLEGNLDADANLATTPATSTSEAFVTTAGPATGGTALTAIVDDNGDPHFTAGDVITISGVQKGGIDLPDTQFVVGADGSTLNDLAAFLEDALAIRDNGDAGVAIGDGTNGPEGSLIVTSDLGQVNAITLDSSSLVNSTSGEVVTDFTSSPADGEGSTTSFIAYDSLGNPVTVRLRAVKIAAESGATTWRIDAESADEATAGHPIGSGTVTFDANGQFITSTDLAININQTNSGAASPLTINLDLSKVNGLADPAGDSVLVMTTQDGSPAGTMIGYEIDDEGVIEATFSNGTSRVIGQVALATFANPQGLVATSDNNFVVGPNSGDPAIVTPRSEGAGRIQSGALESSNVDISRELVGLITASTGVSAASRVVQTADQLLQELMLLAR